MTDCTETASSNDTPARTPVSFKAAAWENIGDWWFRGGWCVSAVSSM